MLCITEIYLLKFLEKVKTFFFFLFYFFNMLKHSDRMFVTLCLSFILHLLLRKYASEKAISNT